MYFQKGSFQHDDNTVTIASFMYRPIRSPRGKRMTTRIELHIAGELLSDPTLTTSLQKQDDLQSQMNTMLAEYEDDYADAGFYRDDGDVTSMFLDSDHANSLTGNYLMYLNFAPGTNEEWCSRRSFTAGIANEFVDSVSDVVDYTDSIRRIGTAGPVKNWRIMPTTQPQCRWLALASTQKIIHMGSTVRLSGYALPPAPLAVGNNYLEHLTELQYTTPKVWGQLGGAFALYRTSWKYVYEFPFNNPLAPTIPITL